MKYFLLLIISLLFFSSNAQQKYDNETVKLEVKSVLSNYEKTINAFINLDSKDKARRAYSNKLKETFESTGVFVYNDLDSNAKDTSTIKMFDYLKVLSSKLPLGSQIKLDLSNCKIDDVTGNEGRNGYTVIAHVKKTIEKKSITATKVFNIDSTTSIVDSSKFKIVSDTNYVKSSVRLTFYFKLKYYGYTYKGAKVTAIAKYKVRPKYRPLKEADQWWVSLSPQWKTIFRQNAKLIEFPDQMDQQKIGFIYKLNLKDRSITTIKPLSKVSQLRSLDLTGNPISSLEGIEKLTNLAELRINGTKIKDLKPLKKCSSLQILECKKLELESLEGISGLINLIELDCSENLLIDIEILKNMNLLEKLDISLNQEIESIEPLRNKPNLTELRMRKMKVKDISAISSCVNMTILDFFSNEIGTLNALKGLKKLAYLDCSFAKIPSLSPLAGHRSLVYFYCGGNAITDINVTRNFYALKHLKIGRTSVESLDPIMKHQYLQRIDIFETNITVSEKDRFKKKHPKCKILYY